MSDTDNGDTDTAPLGERQRDQLESFINASAGLSDDAREAVFTAGVLIGSLADYQRRRENLTTTIADKHPVSRMGPNRLQQAVTEAIDKSTVYAEDYNTVCPGYVSAARDALAAYDLSDSDLSKNDFKFTYALGVSYGFDEYVPPA